jgi:GNAT superfamily N-acetyltransferase
MAEFRVVQISEALAPAVGELERLCFPHADPAELIDLEDAVESARIFPEGFFVVLDGERVVGQGAGIFLDFDFEHPQHNILSITGVHQCGNHSAAGAWYYGTDIAVHPGYRRRGIGRLLYDLRKDLVRRHGKRGILAGGHIPGFVAYKQTMSAAQYIDKVARGEIYDPTLSFQLHQGFRVVTALENYLKDEATDSWSALIRWDNDELTPGTADAAQGRT